MLTHQHNALRRPQWQRMPRRLQRSDASGRGHFGDATSPKCPLDARLYEPGRVQIGGADYLRKVSKKVLPIQEMLSRIGNRSFQAGLTSARLPSSSMARSSSFVTMSRCSVESARYIEQIRYVFVQYTEQVEEGLDARRCEPLSVRGGFRGACLGSAELRLIDGEWLVGAVELDARSVMMSAGLNRLNVVGCKSVFAGDNR